VFAGRLEAGVAGAGMADVGRIVALGKGLLVAAGPAQPPSSARTTTSIMSERICFSSAKKVFKGEISWNRGAVFSIVGSVAKKTAPFKHREPAEPAEYHTCPGTCRACISGRSPPIISQKPRVEKRSARDLVEVMFTHESVCSAPRHSGDMPKGAPGAATPRRGRAQTAYRYSPSRACAPTDLPRRDAADRCTVDEEAGIWGFGRRGDAFPQRAGERERSPSRRPPATTRPTRNASP
jgi:hypothetical protein